MRRGPFFADVDVGFYHFERELDICSTVIGSFFFYVGGLSSYDFREICYDSDLNLYILATYRGRYHFFASNNVLIVVDISIHALSAVVVIRLLTHTLAT